MNDMEDINVEAIADRLEAVADVDWTPTREQGIEYYGDWVKVGPLLIKDFNPEDEDEKYREQERANKEQQEAVIDFLTHAVADIKALLAENKRLAMDYLLDMEP